MPRKHVTNWLSETEKAEVEVIGNKLGLPKAQFSARLGLARSSYPQMTTKNKVPRYVLIAARGLLAEAEKHLLALDKELSPQLQPQYNPSATKFMLTIVDGKPELAAFPQPEQVDYTKYRTMNLDGQDFYLVPQEKVTKPTTVVGTPSVEENVVEDFQVTPRTDGRTTFYPKPPPDTKQGRALAALLSILRSDGPATTKELTEKLRQRGIEVEYKRVSSYVSQELYSESPGLSRNYETGEVFAI